MFACFGVVLFANIDQQGISGQDAFLSFKNAFISLYALSLTVNDPDVYLVSGEGGREGGREYGGKDEYILICFPFSPSFPPSLPPPALLQAARGKYRPVCAFPRPLLFPPPQHHPRPGLSDLLRQAQGNGTQTKRAPRCTSSPPSLPPSLPPSPAFSASTPSSLKRRR